MMNERGADLRYRDVLEGNSIGEEARGKSGR